MRPPIAGILIGLGAASAAPAFGPDTEALRRMNADPEARVSTETEPAPEAREEPPGRAIIRLPAVLGEEDTRHYRRIFALQGEARWRLADAVAERLEDRRLMGYVLAQRYLSVGYRSRYRELRDWLEEHAELPIASEIYELARRKRPRSSPSPGEPEGVHAAERPRRVSRERLPGPRWSRAQARQAGRYSRVIRRNLRRDRLTITGRLLARSDVSRLFGPVRIDVFRARLALRWYHLGRMERAHEISSAAAGRSGHLVTNAHWVAGLSAWVLQRYEEAAGHFARVAMAAGEDTRLRAAGAYWASRSHAALEDEARAAMWLRQASDHSRTFYGVLARQRLNIAQDFDWQPESPDVAVIEALARTEAGRRGFALLQAGRYADAGREFLRLYFDRGERHAATFVALADTGDMPGLGFRIGARAYRRSGARHDTGLYPLPAWQPEEGFRLDRALLFAVIRQESAFDVRARSHAGARGLMQLMPATASMVARDRSLRRRQAARLYDPHFNIGLGQRFMRYLLRRPSIRGNLFFAVAAYNAGEGNLNRWQTRSDPLLFVESIHLRETRHYVKRVMYNYWAYRFRMGQATPSLKALAEGDWPVYRAQEAP